MNAFTQKPKLDAKWIKTLNQSVKNRQGGRTRADEMGGMIVPGMGTRDLEKVKVKK